MAAWSRTVRDLEPPRNAVPRLSGRAIFEDLSTHVDRCCTCSRNVSKLGAYLVGHRGSIGNVKEVERQGLLR